jgi:DNA-binding NtrC family response regulator
MNPMGSSLRILSLEDDPNDAELIQELLESEGIDCEIARAETGPRFLALLEEGDIDLILADYTLPGFDGISALKLALERRPDVPFIFVSGTLGEEVAIEALKIGATDYVLKTRLSRLPMSVRRAMREAVERAERKRAEEALRCSEAYLAQAQHLSRTGSFGWNAATGEIYWSLETFRIFECDPASAPSLDLVMERTHPADRALLQEVTARATAERSDFDLEHRLQMPDGSVKYLRVVSRFSAKSEAGEPLFVGAVMDITERKRAETDLENALCEIKKLKDQLYEENVALKEEVDKASMFEEIVGESAALQALLARVSKVAPTDSTVLLTGETGTGKELFARAIHKRSRRAARPFVSVNCAAVPASLIASELFGHEKGAFTGAVQRRLGRFELAEGGTLFLDEAGELPQETQVALLRVLQEREFERVGGGKPIRADVRVIAATNRDLQSSIDAGAFRSDLYYRLNVFPVAIPPLRERREDIPLLVEYFIHRYASRTGKKIRGINRATLERLRSYSWPGNIRELQNVIERSMIVSDSANLTIDPSWLPDASAEPATEPATALLKIRAADEKRIIEAALAASHGRVSGPTGAAAKLGVPPSTLDSKIRALGINKHRYRTSAGGA